MARRALPSLAFPLIVGCLRGPAPAIAPPPERIARGQVLVSARTPAVRIEIDPAFRYVGSQRFILYGVADAEQHFFVDADRSGRIRRLYWIQFEGYLPSNRHRYRYKRTRTVAMAGMEFIADAWPRSTRAPTRPGSDGARARALLEKNGYSFPPELIAQRLVHLTDERRRDELMILYAEDLGPSGHAAADLAPGGRAAGAWPKVADGLLQRAVAGMKLAR
jgi:hypothetical protein